MFKALFLLLALLSPVVGVNADEKPTTAFPVQVELIPEKAAILVGEPTYLKFRVTNPTDDDWQVGVGGDYRNSTGRPDSFQLSYLDAQGQVVQQAEKGWNMGGLFTTRTVPAHGHYDYSLFLPHWFKIRESGKITVTAKRTLLLSIGKSFNFSTLGKGSKVPVEASASLQVLPYDAEKLGQLIEQLGNLMLLDRQLSVYQGTSENRLAAIEDPRIIPYFVRAIDMRRFEGIEVLGRYNNDGAFNALKNAMIDTGADDNIRHRIASALSRSPHPDALDFLITQRHDPYHGVRITVVQRLSSTDEKRAIPLLKEMSLDSNASVSGEAKRILKEFEAKRLAPE